MIFRNIAIIYINIALSITSVYNATLMRMLIRQMKEDIAKEWKKTTKTRYSRDQTPFNINKSFQTYVEKDWSNCKVINLHGRVGLQLIVRYDKVVGVTEDNRKQDEGFFQIESYGSSVIRLLDIKSQQYIILTEGGDIGIKAEKTSESLFFHHLEENGYDTFASVKYYMKNPYDLFLSIKRNGKPRQTKLTSAGQKSSQFIPLHIKSEACERFF